MASIQCAIELYDGVSPALSTMAESMDGLIGKFESLEVAGGLVTSLVDAESMAQSAAALSSLMSELDSVRGVAGSVADSMTLAVEGLSVGLGSVANFAGVMAEGFSQASVQAAQMASAVQTIQISAQGIYDTMSVTFEANLFDGFNAAIAMVQISLQTLGEVGQLTADGLNSSFVLAGESIALTFNNMSTRITSVFSSLGSYIQSFASSLPSYFSGPLNSIASMFSTMAASARASLASISSAASSAASSVRSAASSISASVASVASLSLSGAMATLSVSSIGEEGMVGLQSVNMEDDRGVGISSYKLGDIVAGRQTENAGQTVINVEVNNENYISSEADVDAVLREFEDRLTEAVLSSAEGVY